MSVRSEPDVAKMTALSKPKTSFESDVLWKQKTLCTGHFPDVILSTTQYFDGARRSFHPVWEISRGPTIRDVLWELDNQFGTDFVTGVPWEVVYTWGPGIR